jgi:large subunit ribosomal protein L6
MSRIGKLPVKIPEKVTVTFADKNMLVKGPKGQLSMTCSDEIALNISEDTIILSVLKLSPKSKKEFGMYRALIANMIQGVTTGFEKKLELQGVGYRSQVQGKSLILNVGYSHQVKIDAPDGIKITVDGNTNVSISGINKQLVGQIAANIRSVRPPEPYKGKGIRYQGEHVRKKAGKAGKKK